MPGFNPAAAPPAAPIAAPNRPPFMPPPLATPPIAPLIAMAARGPTPGIGIKLAAIGANFLNKSLLTTFLATLRGAFTIFFTPLNTLLKNPNSGIPVIGLIVMYSPT